MRLSILAAVAENGVIGAGGALPWHLPDELRHVKQLTTGHTLLMGRKTFESIGRPLPNRTSIVVSRSASFRPEGAIVVASLESAVETASERGETEAFVFGGASLYAGALLLAERLYLTRVHARVAGDVHFPDFDERNWKLVDERRHPADEHHAHAFTFQTWDRLRPDPA